MADLKVLMWNCGGLRASTISTQSKMMFFEKEFKNDFHVAIFLETHHRDDKEIPPEVLRYGKTHHIINSPIPPNDKYSGILILLHKDFDLINTQTPIPGRILNVKIQQKHTKNNYNISAVYNYTNSRTNAKTFQAIVTALCSVNQDDSQNIITGDFNFAEHNKDKTKGMDSTDMMASKIWQPAMAEINMVDPFRAQNPNRKMWSFVGHGLAGNSRGDRVYVNEENMQNVVNYKHVITPFPHAHRVLSFSIQNQTPRGPGYWKMNTSILRDRQYKESIEQIVAEMEGLGITDEIEWWQLFLLTVRSKTIVYCQDKNKVKKSLKRIILRQMLQMEQDPLERTNEHKNPHYNYLTEKLKQIEEAEIEGYKRRIKYLGNYEKGETDIAFYAKLEKNRAAKNTISQLAETKDGPIQTDTEQIMRIASNFYKELYTTAEVDGSTQNKLLRNIKNKVTPQQQEILDADITSAEAEKSVFQMQQKKSPGIDGIPIEFYQQFWYLINDRYMAYINKVKILAFPETKNTSVMTLIYKEKGEIYLLENYRPISLLNVDVKILTKILTNRLKYVLPSIIHASQTAVFGRKIDETVHMIRDLIDIANKEDTGAAFIFLDQEKAFDRVNHQFLYKTMEAFGIGDTFINWIKVIYSNATSILNINGFLSAKIRLNRGVRQGCPLSALLYVLVIEVLAIQLRLNPNIVGFQVGGEKIVSAHYVDDAIITILQNRCFKEVIKDLAQYEQASGAKINYKKTKGLWTGSWKGRADTPMDIKWTSENVENLGIFFGNDNPALHTFQKIIPKVNSQLAYWRQFKISVIGKARIVDMFVLSKLCYAAKFYTIPTHYTTELQKSIFNYINQPNKTVTVKQAEMWKIKLEGGIKLINIKIKSEAFKIMWLIELLTKDNLKISMNIFDRLIGNQIANIRGKDLMFLELPLVKRRIEREKKIQSQFYPEAIVAFAGLETKKAVLTIRDEHLFHNPIFTRYNGKPIPLAKYYKENNIYTYGQLLDEDIKKENNLPYNKVLTGRLYNTNVAEHIPKEHTLIPTSATRSLTFKELTHRIIYEELIFRISTLHGSQVKWIDRIANPIRWDDVWRAVHNTLATHQTKTTIWQQLHLNFYTTYKYNTWHQKKGVGKCPLCHEIPTDVYHIILHCPYTVNLWNEIEPILKEINPTPVNDEEKSFGLTTRITSDDIILRNWLTYTLRDCIREEEARAFYEPNAKPDLKAFQRRYNSRIKQEIYIKEIQFKQENKEDIFEKVITHKKVLCFKLPDGQYDIRNVFIISILN